MSAGKLGEVSWVKSRGKNLLLSSAFPRFSSWSVLSLSLYLPYLSLTLSLSSLSRSLSLFSLFFSLFLSVSIRDLKRDLRMKGQGEER